MSRRFRVKNHPDREKKDQQFISGNGAHILQEGPSSGAQKRSLPVLLFQAAGEMHPSLFREILVIGCIESFEVTVFIRLLFTGFECEKGAVGMVLADTGNTEPE
jgi:hypothetical protein